MFLINLLVFIIKSWKNVSFSWKTYAAKGSENHWYIFVIAEMLHLKY